MSSEAERVANSELSAAVSKAVNLAIERRGLTAERGPFGSDHFRVPWWVVGRLVRDVEQADAFDLARQVTDDVAGELGFDLVPAMTVVDRDILVGFIERFEGRIPVPHGRLGGPF